MAEVSFGEWLRRQRKAAGLTQDQLAVQISCSTSALKKIEAEERRPSAQIVEQLAEIFNIPQNERKAFLRFARGDWRAAPTGVENAPWRFPHPQEREDQSKSKIVTFLFTDIEGSIKLSQQYPDALPNLLARHHEILNQSILAHNGHVFQIIGDAFCAAFDSPSDALNAALEAQRYLQNESWSPAPIKVRMGINTGSAQIKEDSNETQYEGYASLALTQRIMSAAHGGQILLSQSTFDLVRDRLPEKVQLLDLGECRLKDVFRPEHLYQLVAPDLPSKFPPLNIFEIAKHNLPTQLTSFIGREREIGEAKKLLSSTRLLTFIGPGGTGKSRLSLQVAADVLDQFPNGVWFVELAPLAEPAFLVSAIASIFGLGEMQNIPLIQILLDYLRAKQLLLILDNCEHLVEASAQIASQILHECPQAKILASSREALNIDGETVYRVQSLLEDEARQLFIERATKVEPRFHVTETNASSIAQICSSLDGIPLAIELAAARIKVFTPEQIAARLDDRFKLLTGGTRTALPHQQTLRALIDWSYETLNETEQRAFRRLAVFAGGWTFEAAEAVIGENEAMEGLAGLVNKSLVNVEEEQDNEGRYPSKGSLRYRFLETIRQYAVEKLMESGDATEAQERHLNYFVEFAGRVEKELNGAESRIWLKLLELELDNFRNSLRWALENRPQAALLLVGLLADFWFDGGYIAEGRDWCKTVLAQAEQLPHDGGEIDKARAEALTVLAFLSFGNDIRSGQMAAKESVALARQIGDPGRLARALQALGWVCIRLGEHHAGQIATKESVALARQIGDTLMLGWSLRTLGLASAFLGDTTMAFDSLHEGEAIARQMGYKDLLMRVLESLAMITESVYGKKTEDQAQTYLEESIALSHELGDTRTMMFSEADLVLLELSRGNLDDARNRIERVLAFHREMGNLVYLNQFQSNVAHTWRGLGNFREALAIYRETILFWQKIDHRGAVAHQLECFGFIAKAREQGERAIKLLSAAEVLREVCDSPMTPKERAEYEKEVVELRAGMDEKDFDSIWAEGRAMTMEQAIAYALE